MRKEGIKGRNRGSGVRERKKWINTEGRKEGQSGRDPQGKERQK